MIWDVGRTTANQEIKVAFDCLQLGSRPEAEKT
jgi:hypothetical protein